jgi:hypothetical protein
MGKTRAVGREDSMLEYSKYLIDNSLDNKEFVI